MAELRDRQGFNLTQSQATIAAVILTGVAAVVWSTTQESRSTSAEFASMKGRFDEHIRFVEMILWPEIREHDKHVSAQQAVWSELDMTARMRAVEQEIARLKERLSSGGVEQRPDP